MGTDTVGADAVLSSMRVTATKSGSSGRLEGGVGGGVSGEDNGGVAPVAAVGSKEESDSLGFSILSPSFSDEAACNTRPRPDEYVAVAHLFHDAWCWWNGNLLAPDDGTTVLVRTAAVVTTRRATKSPEVGLGAEHRPGWKNAPANDTPLPMMKAAKTRKNLMIRFTA